MFAEEADTQGQPACLPFAFPVQDVGTRDGRETQEGTDRKFTVQLAGKLAPKCLFLPWVKLLAHGLKLLSGYVLVHQ